MILAEDPAERLRSFHEIDLAVVIVEAAVQAMAAAILHKRGEKSVVRLDTYAFPAERSLQQLGIARPPAIRCSRIEKESTSHSTEDFENKRILAVLREASTGGSPHELSTGLRMRAKAAERQAANPASGSFITSRLMRPR